MANDYYIPINCIDSLNISQNIIEKCWKEYTYKGKNKIYDYLESIINNSRNIKNRTFLYLYLYRIAMFQTMCFSKKIDKSTDVMLHPMEQKKIPILIDNELIEMDIREYNSYIKTHNLEDENTVPLCPYCARPLYYPLKYDDNIQGYNQTDYNEYGDINSYCEYIDCPTKRTFSGIRKWSFNNMDATIPSLSKDGIGYISKCGFKLDDYVYKYTYKNSKLKVIDRGGSSLLLKRRFDFEFKYASMTDVDNNEINIPEYYTIYQNILLETFRVSYYKSVNKGVFVLLSEEESLCISKILSEISIAYKLKIASFVKKFMRHEKLYSNMTDQSMDIDNYMYSHNEICSLLSEFHEKFLLPIEFLSYLLCAVVSPKHFIIMNDTFGGVSSKLLNGNIDFYSNLENNTLGINHKQINSNNIYTHLTDSFNRYTYEDISLKDTWYLYFNKDTNDLSIFSFLENKWIVDKIMYPILDNDLNPANYLVDKTIIKIFSYITETDSKIFLLYDNICCIYDMINNVWMDSYNTADLFTLNTNEDYGKFEDAIYDNYDKTVVFINTDYKIASVNILDNKITKSNGFIDTECRTTIHYENNNIVSDDDFILPEYDNSIVTIIPKFDKIFLMNGYDDNDNYIPVYAITDGYNVQIIKYENEIILPLVSLRFSDTSKIVEIIHLTSKRKTYLLYDNQKIVQLSTFIYSPFIIREGDNDIGKLISAHKILGTTQNCINYVTDNNDSRTISEMYTLGIDTGGSGRITNISDFISPHSNITNCIESIINFVDFELYSKKYIKHEKYSNSNILSKN